MKEEGGFCQAEEISVLQRRGSKDRRQKRVCFIQALCFFVLLSKPSLLPAFRVHLGFGSGHPLRCLTFPD